MEFVFVHAADLHLDSPLQGLLSDVGDKPPVARTLQRSTSAAFESLVELCIREKARFLVLSGDIYDGETSSLSAQLRLRRGLERLAEHDIKAFIVHGNHDPLDTANRAVSLPANTHVFGSEAVETVPVHAADHTLLATVSGVSYRSKRETRQLQTHFEAPDSQAFHIAALHCNVGNSGYEDYVPCLLDELVGKGFHYWALGHVHENRVLHTAPHVVYPGCMQGRSIRETGPRGCYVVRADSDAPQNTGLEFVELDAVRWQLVEVGAEGLDMLDALLDRAAEAIESALETCGGRSLVCRLHVTGRTPLFRDLSDPNVQQDMLEKLRQDLPDHSEPCVWVESIRVNCLPEADLERCREAQDLLGEALRIAAEAGGNDQLRQQFREALQPLFEHRRARKILEPPDDQDFGLLLEDAALLCYDLLTEEGGA